MGLVNKPRLQPLKNTLNLLEDLKCLPVTLSFRKSKFQQTKNGSDESVANLKKY